MALTYDAARFLVNALVRGVSFERTLTIGRPFLFADPDQLRTLLDRPADAEPQSDRGFADGFLRSLGARQLHALDVSDYEGATVLHDMNEPVPNILKCKYSVVYDTGSLEHIFNFPVAIRNCMEMVEVGGHFILIGPANNWCGHGFYQFSPELFARLFVPNNGFELTLLVLKSATDKSFYSIRPAALGGGRRACLINNSPTEVCVLARKVSHCEAREIRPVQGMYEHYWAEPATFARKRSFVDQLVGSSLLKQLLQLTSTPVRDYARLLYRRHMAESFRNKAVFGSEPMSTVTSKPEGAVAPPHAESADSVRSAHN